MFSGFGRIYTRFSGSCTDLFRLFPGPRAGVAERSAARIAFANGIRGGYDNIYVTNKNNNHVRI